MENLRSFGGITPVVSARLPCGRPRGMRSQARCIDTINRGVSSEQSWYEGAPPPSCCATGGRVRRQTLLKWGLHGQPMDIVPLLIIFLTGLVTAAFGTLVGGSSLITIPVLILLGLPPHAAIGTDRTGVTAIGLAGIYQFHKKGLIRYGVAFILGIPCLVGSLIGANLAFQVSPAVMKKTIAVMTLAMLAILIAKPNGGLKRHSRR